MWIQEQIVNFEIHTGITNARLYIDCQNNSLRELPNYMALKLI